MPGFETFDAGSMAASGIKSLLDFGFAQLGSAIDSKRAFKYWNRQRDRIITEARAAYNLQRADALKDTLQQYQLDVAANKNAGLNPALGEGQGAVTMSQPDINAQDNGAIQSSSGQVTFNPLLQAQLENIRADTQEKLKSAGLKGSQIDLNKQIFDQNLEKWPIVKRILGNEDLLKEIEVKQGYLGLKKFRKELKILDETLKQSKVTTDNMTKDNQVKAVEVYLRVMRTIADYYKTVEEIGEVRSKTSLNYASASNQRAQAWLAPYQARNLVSGEALNYAKVKTEGTQQQLNGMLYKEAGERMKNWMLNNQKQRYDNKIRAFQADLTKAGVNPDCSNVFSQLLQFGGALYSGSILPIVDIVTDWFGTAIIDKDAKKSLDKVRSYFVNYFHPVVTGRAPKGRLVLQSPY